MYTKYAYFCFRPFLVLIGTDLETLYILPMRWSGSTIDPIFIELGSSEGPVLFKFEPNLGFL